MLPSRKYDEWSQQEHEKRDYQSEVEERFFGAVENPKAAPEELRNLYREFGKYLEKGN